MRRKAQQGMRVSTAPQTVQELKTQLQNLSNIDVQQLPNQLEELTNTVEQLETQVQQLEQMRLQQQQQIQQAVQTAQQTDDMESEASDKSKVSVNKKDKRHLSPRDSEHNKELPDFWRKNYDYGESPYMNLEEIEKITDKPPISKRVKKKK